MTMILINLTVLDRSHQVTLTSSISAWHSTHFLPRVCSKCMFPTWFGGKKRLKLNWVQTGRIQDVLTSLLFLFLYRNWYTFGRPHRCQTVCITLWNLSVFSLVSCTWRLLLGTSQPVACKNELAPGANITPLWPTSLQLMSSHPQTEIEPAHFLSSCEVAAWVRVRDGSVLNCEWRRWP